MLTVAGRDSEEITNGFMSYVRADNDMFGGVVDRLHQELASTYEAQTGKTLRIFLDRESIGWGADWRQDIRDSIERAVVFMPVVTMRYFNSDACVEELIAFYTNAEQLGVTELILPLVLMGEDRIAADDPREEVRLIERLNQKRIGAAWRAGYDSPEWRALVFDLVQSLDRAITSAENALAEHEASEKSLVSTHAASDHPADGESSEDEDAAPDLSDMYTRSESLTELLHEVLGALNSFAEAANEHIGTKDWENLSAQQLRVRLMSAANALGKTSAELGRKGDQLQRETAEVDAAIRGIVNELGSIGGDFARNALDELVGQFSDMDLQETVQSINELLEVLQFASLMNITLRKALRPGIQGLQGIRRAATTVESWAQLR